MHKHILSRFATILLLSFFALMANAQKIKVSGTVVDGQTQEPLMGVTVIEKGTSNGTVTDIDGKYSITVASKAILNLSFMGFATEQVAVNGRSVVDVNMKPE